MLTHFESFRVPQEKVILREALEAKEQRSNWSMDRIINRLLFSSLRCSRTCQKILDIFYTLYRRNSNQVSVSLETKKKEKLGNAEERWNPGTSGSCTKSRRVERAMGTNKHMGNISVRKEDER